MSWFKATQEVLECEWQLLRGHRKLALAMAGVLFVPALYAWIYLFAMWDPASHTRDLPAGLVNLDQGAQYRKQTLNLGQEVLVAIEAQQQFAYRRYEDPQQARQDVRQGRLAFMLEIPADFSQRALPGERPGAAKLTIYTSEGNNYASASFARRFAPEVAQRVNTMLAEARWDLVLSSAAGSQRNLDSLRSALGDLHKGASELQAGLSRARDGGRQAALASESALESAQRLRAGAGQVAEGSQQLGGGVRQMGASLRAMEARMPPESELAALRQGTRALADGQQDLLRGLDALGAGTQQLEAGLLQLRTAAEEIPLFGGSVVEGIAPITAGARELGAGVNRAREAQTRLLQGTQRLQEGVGALADGTARARAAVNTMQARLPEEARLDRLTEGSREMVNGHEALLGGLRQMGSGSQVLNNGLSGLVDGVGRLDTGLELLRRSLPADVDRPEGNAQGLALSVEPLIEVVAPVPNQGSALAPNFVPLALWVGAVMVAFLVHLRRVPEQLGGHPRLALAAGKLLLPLCVVLLQSMAMLALLVLVLKVPMPRPGLLALTLATTSVAFLAIVWALVRVMGDLGKVVAVLLLIVQVSAAGALVPIELSDESFQALHPYLPLTWVVQTFRATLFGAYDGQFWPTYAFIAWTGTAGLVIGALVGRWRTVPAAQWRPPLDIE
ncbi:MAG: YhgE/Pip domain-containing protein [Betaproteobacteria bacterium]